MRKLSTLLTLVLCIGMLHGQISMFVHQNNSSTDSYNIDDVRKKLKFDFYYIENLSFSLDVKILASTFWVMLSGKGR